MKCLLHMIIVDDSLFENSVRPLWIHYTNALPNSILTIIKGAINFPSALAEWIFAIPLVHFLEEQCKPFDKLHSIEWEYIGESSHRYVHNNVYSSIYNLYFRYQWGDDMLSPSKEFQRYASENNSVDTVNRYILRTIFRYCVGIYVGSSCRNTVNNHYTTCSYLL